MNTMKRFYQIEKNHIYLIILALTIGTSIKLVFSLTTIGTNDVMYWFHFMRYIVEHGSVTIYKDIGIYNHPPLMSQMLLLFSKLQPFVYNGFPFLIRLPAILADIGSCILIYLLIKRFRDSQSALFSAILLALSPILIFVSGFHGNTDSVFMFLILLAAYSFLVKRSILLSAVIIGLSLNIKIVPILVIPAFFLFIDNWKHRIQFCGVVSLVFLSGFLYHIVMDFHHLYRNIFNYAGIPGVWGISMITRHLFGYNIAEKYTIIGKLGIFVTVMFSMYKLAKFSTKNRPEKLTDKDVNQEKVKGQFFLFALGLTFLLFFIFTPGFGVQYLVWFVIPSILIGTYRALIYNLIGGVFLFLVYSFWCEGIIWYYANSHEKGLAKGEIEIVELILWFFLLYWLILIIRKKRDIFIPKK